MDLNVVARREMFTVIVDLDDLAHNMIIYSRLVISGFCANAQILVCVDLFRTLNLLRRTSESRLWNF